MVLVSRVDSIHRTPGRAYTLTLWRFQLGGKPLAKELDIRLFESARITLSLYLTVTQRCASRLVVVAHRRPTRGGGSVECFADVIDLHFVGT